MTQKQRSPNWWHSGKRLFLNQAQKEVCLWFLWGPASSRNCQFHEGENLCSKFNHSFIQCKLIITCFESCPELGNIKVGRSGHRLKGTRGKGGDRKWRDTHDTGSLVVLEVGVGCRVFRENHCEIKQMAHPQRPPSRKKHISKGTQDPVPFCSFICWVLFFFNVNHFQSPHQICYNTDSISMPWLLGNKACRIPASQLGTELAPTSLEGEVATAGPPQKSHCVISNVWNFYFWSISN